MNKIKLFAFFILLNLSCVSNTKDSSFFPNEDAIKSIGWKCYQTIDVINNKKLPQHLKVTIHSKKISYPSISIPWFTGNISKLDTIGIIFHNPDKTRNFYLFLWDNIGKLSYNNRYNYVKKCKYTENNKLIIDTMLIDLTKGLYTNSGRKINLKKIKLAIFFTTKGVVPFSFDIFDIIKIKSKK